MKKILSSRKALLIISFIGLYFLATGLSWTVFSFASKGLSLDTSTEVNSSELGKARAQLTSELPKTEVCPINGQKFTSIEREIWEARRPIAVMIENHADSRPPSGLSKADVVYEIVAEGGITRFLAIFYCGASAEDVEIAPVRSARIYFINLATEYGDRPIFAHVGGANNICGNCPKGVKPRGTVAPEVQAIEELQSLGWRIAGGNDFDTTYDAGYPVFWRNYERLDHPVATEHTMMSSTDKIYAEARKRGFENEKDGTPWDKTFRTWKFIDGQAATSPNASHTSFEFWSNKPEYDVKWEYDRSGNVYKRFNGGSAHTDLGQNNRQLTAENVVIMFLKEKGPVDSELHMYYETGKGRGKAMVFQNGNVVEGTWEKESQDSRTVFYDELGKEIEFVRGVIWIEGVPSGNEIEYS